MTAALPEPSPSGSGSHRPDLCPNQRNTNDAQQPCLLPSLARAAIAAALTILTIVAAACSPAVGAVPPSERPATPSPSAAPPTLIPPPSLIPVRPTPGPVEPTDLPAQPRPSEPASPSDPTPRPAPELTAAERELIGRIRPDARGDCTPRRTNLPDGAIAGVECRPAGTNAARVGFYAFESNRDAGQAYFDRILANDVEPDGGDCWRGVPGDGGWVPGDGTLDLGSDHDIGIVIDGVSYVSLRQGCFVDDDGNANVRLTCGDAIYVGVVGRDDDLASLYRWAIHYPAGVPMPTPTMPGICLGGPEV